MLVIQSIHKDKKPTVWFLQMLISRLSSTISWCVVTGTYPALSWTLRSVCHWTSGTGAWTRWPPAPQLWSCAFSSGRSAPGGRWWRRPWECRACPRIRWRSDSWTLSEWWSGWTSATETQKSEKSLHIQLFTVAAQVYPWKKKTLFIGKQCFSPDEWFIPWFMWSGKEVLFMGLTTFPLCSFSYCKI